MVEPEPVGRGIGFRPGRTAGQALGIDLPAPQQTGIDLEGPTE
jgi:hypothetical protein